MTHKKLTKQHNEMLRKLRKETERTLKRMETLRATAQDNATDYCLASNDDGYEYWEDVENDLDDVVSFLDLAADRMARLTAWEG